MDSRSKGYILAKYDISGIQRYIFATNRLKENVGASCQVTKILEEYLPDSIKEASAPQDTYVISWEKQDKLNLPHDKTINTEIIYIGGGNAMVLFRDKEVFQMVSQNLARKVAKNCQGIYLAAAYTDTQLVNFAEDVKKLNKNMADKKAGMIRQPIYSPFPAVEQDNSNHQPITRCCRHRDEANSYEKKGDKEKHQIENMTEMQYQKWIAYGEAREKRTGKLYPNIGEKVNYDYPVDMDLLCREPGGNSYTAVVHIDGNGMGAQIQKVLREHAEYEKAVLGLRKMSKEISAVFENTYKEMLKVVYSYSKHPCSGDEDRMILPLRPIVLDGDDFTFLCTADLAIPLAVGFMKKLMKGQEGKPEKISACAGIAFVHSHFPFYEAYCIAEDSCSDAKKKWYEESREKGSCESCFLDFRILKGSEVGGTVRHRELQMRPYYVDEKERGHGTDSLTALCETVKKMKEWPSNRLHRISRAMLEGDIEMKSLEREFISRDYHIKDLVQTDDWKNSPLYDALEIRGLCEMELLEDFLDMQENKGDGKMDSEDKVNK